MWSVSCLFVVVWRQMAAAATTTEVKSSAAGAGGGGGVGSRLSLLDGIRLLYPVLLQREAKHLAGNPSKLESTVTKFVSGISKSGEENQRRILMDLKQRLKITAPSPCTAAAAVDGDDSTGIGTAATNHHLYAVFSQVMNDNPDSEELHRQKERAEAVRWSPIPGAAEFSVRISYGPYSA